MSERRSASRSSSPRASRIVMPWSPMGPESKTLSPALHRARVNLHAAQRTTDARRRDVHAIGLAVFHDLGVAAGDLHSRSARGICHRAHFRLQQLCREARLRERNVTTMASARAPDTARSFTVPFTASSPMDPPGKLNGLTTKLSVVMAICAAIDGEMRGISQRFCGCAKEQWSKQAFDEPATGLAAGSVSHFNLWFAEAHSRRSILRGFPRDIPGGAFRNRGRCHAVWPTMFTIAVLRCS